MCCRSACVMGALALACAACAPGPALDDPETPTVALPQCTNDSDGRITRAELPFIAGAVAKIRVGTDVEVDTDGTAGRGSARVWDLSRPDPADEPQGALTLEPMDGQWFADSFPDAQHAGPLAPDNALLGPLSIDDDGVWLYGSASDVPDPAAGRTLLAYSTPVLLYPFPLELGAHAETTALVPNGTAYGIPVAWQDVTTVDVTAHGQVTLPDLILEDALRVTLRIARTPVAGVAVHQVTHVFVHPCIGEVARIASPPVPLDEPLDDEFTTAREVWRLGF